MWILILQRIALDFLLSIIYFPFWWYSGGIKKAGIYSLNLFLSGNSSLAPGLWLKNIFVPMFGQTDWQGRLVSVLMRFVNIIFRALALVLWAVVAILVFLLWLAWLPALVYLLLRFVYPVK